MAAEAVGNKAATPPMRSLTFQDLPAEIQQDILSHVRLVDAAHCVFCDRTNALAVLAV